jgi:hypothetical protein
MKGKKYELTESRETLIKGGFVSILADTANKHRLFRFGPLFHKLKLSEMEEMAMWSIPRKSQNVVTYSHTTPGYKYKS